jgi:hypothetical protein
MEDDIKRVQIRPSINIIFSTALDVMSKKEKIPLGRLIDRLLSENEEFSLYVKEVENLYVS